MHVFLNVFYKLLGNFFLLKAFLYIHDFVLFVRNGLWNYFYHTYAAKRSGIINEDGKNKISGTSANPAIHMANKIFSQKYMKSVHLLTLM